MLRSQILLVERNNDAILELDRQTKLTTLETHTERRLQIPQRVWVMPTAVMEETADASGGNVRPPFEVHPLGPLALGAMEQHEMESMELDEQVSTPHMSRIQELMNFVISWMMLFSGFAVIIAGMTARQETGWGLTFIICYVIWTLGVSTCLYLNLKKADFFVKCCASHLLCCAVTLYFFTSALQIPSTDFPMYIPMGVNLGLLLSTGLQHVSMPSIMQSLSFCGIGYNYPPFQQAPILPQYEPRLRSNRMPRQPGADASM